MAHIMGGCMGRGLQRPNYRHRVIVAGVAKVPATTKTPKKIVVRWDARGPIRQALPAEIKNIAVIHVARWVRIGQQMIPCQRGETPAQQVKLVSRRFGELMDINEWKAVDDQIAI
jgi:hypothetical protein